MYFTSLEGKREHVDLHKYYNDESEKKSNLHLLARELITKLLPNTSRYEEVPVTLERKRKKVHLDFFLPTVDLVVEVQGKQHYKYSKLMHKSKAEFARAKGRDRDKVEWCDINGLTIIHLKYNETNKWEGQIAEFVEKCK